MRSTHGPFMLAAVHATFPANQNPKIEKLAYPTIAAFGFSNRAPNHPDRTGINVGGCDFRCGHSLIMPSRLGPPRNRSGSEYTLKENMISVRPTEEYS